MGTIYKRQQQEESEKLKKAQSLVMKNMLFDPEEHMRNTAPKTTVMQPKKEKTPGE